MQNSIALLKSCRLDKYWDFYSDSKYFQVRLEAPPVIRPASPDMDAVQQKRFRVRLSSRRGLR
jgi:hypothetical protein